MKDIKKKVIEKAKGEDKFIEISNQRGLSDKDNKAAY